MSTEFDASQVCTDPVSEETLAEQERTMVPLIKMPNALANAKLHAVNDLQRYINVCNRLAWGAVPADLREPTAEEAAALFQRLSPEDADKLRRESRSAAAQRVLVARMEEAQQHHLAQLQAEQHDLAQREVEAQEWAEFEAQDAAEQGQRFQAWRASRGR